MTSRPVQAVAPPDPETVLNRARATFDIEADAVRGLKSRIGAGFVEAVRRFGQQGNQQAGRISGRVLRQGRADQAPEVHRFAPTLVFLSASPCRIPSRRVVSSEPGPAITPSAASRSAHGSAVTPAPNALAVDHQCNEKVPHEVLQDCSTILYLGPNRRTGGAHGRSPTGPRSVRS